MSWLSKLFPSAGEASSTSAAEEISMKQAQEAEEKRLAQTAANKVIAQQLIAWGETDPISELPEPPFQDPLGHLTFEEQKQYFTNPPETYLKTLEDRQRARELHEQQLFLIDPMNNWRFCYSTKPDFTQSMLPRWVPWKKERRVQVMEKYRRYDERFQRQIQEIYEKYDSPSWRDNMRTLLSSRWTKHVQRNAIRAARSSKNQGKQVVVQEAEEVPLSVVEVRVHRYIINSRNRALNRLWNRYIWDVAVFEDISEDGVVASDERRKKFYEIREKRRTDEQRQSEIFKEWSTLPVNSRVERVDWSAISTET
jgi:hypothetical protein